MKTIRLTRQGFSLHGMHSWIKFFIFILSKKYNVIIDNDNPDIVLTSNLFHYNEGDYDTFLKAPTKIFRDNNRKYLFVSGELADFLGVINNHANYWSIGYQNFQHDKYLRVPSYVIDIWTLFDEARIYDCPFDWLTKNRDFNNIISKQKGFCSITQASDQPFRGLIFDKLSEYKKVTSSGPWRQNVDAEDMVNKYEWLKPEYIGRNDGLTYREKINFFQKFKFNIAIHLVNTDYIVQEKLIHAYASGAIPIFFGNKYIEAEGFNPETFINLHNYENDLDAFLSLVKKIDNNNDLHKSYIEKPIFIDNKLPEYMNFDYTLAFLEKMIES